MMRPILFALGAMAAFSAVDAGERAIGVEDVIARHHELDGKRIRVHGWLGNCWSNSCGLFSSADEDAALRLSIGSSKSFDLKARSLKGRHVEIEATVDAGCMHIKYDEPPPENSEICLDRAEELASPILIRKLRK